MCWSLQARWGRGNSALFYRGLVAASSLGTEERYDVLDATALATLLARLIALLVGILLGFLGLAVEKAADHPHTGPDGRS